MPKTPRLSPNEYHALSPQARAEHLLALVRNEFGNKINRAYLPGSTVAEILLRRLHGVTKRRSSYEEHIRTALWEAQILLERRKELQNAQKRIERSKEKHRLRPRNEWKSRH